MARQAGTVIKRNESREEKLKQEALSLEHGQEAQLHSLIVEPYTTDLCLDAINLFSSQCYASFALPEPEMGESDYILS